MSQTWVIPTGDDLWQVVSRSIVQKVDEDVLGGKNETNDFDGTLDTRAKKAVEYAIKEVRGAIETAGRYPVSLTAGSVPPEGQQHVLAIAAWRLCLPVPGLIAVLMADGGAFSPIGTLYKAACDWVKMIANGGSFTDATNPAGANYRTAIDNNKSSATYNPAVSGLRWGCNLGDDDEFAAGITDDGVVISRFSENMNTL